MKGWKTWIGSACVAIGTTLKTLPIYFAEQAAIGDLLLGLGMALMGVGIAHKIEKAKL